MAARAPSTHNWRAHIALMHANRFPCAASPAVTAAASSTAVATATIPATAPPLTPAPPLFSGLIAPIGLQQRRHYLSTGKFQSLNQMCVMAWRSCSSWTQASVLRTNMCTP